MSSTVVEATLVKNPLKTESSHPSPPLAAASAEHSRIETMRTRDDTGTAFALTLKKVQHKFKRLRRRSQVGKRMLFSKT